MKANSINGILLFDKSSNITSNKALQKVKKVFAQKKAGHSGTLDPLATGLLPIFFGEATKVTSYLLNASKTYHVIAKLGVRTDSGDSDGNIIEERNPLKIKLSDFNKIIKKFEGESYQTPPMYSAIKINGKRLYQYAQKGKTIERKARKIFLHNIKLINLSSDEFEIELKCSKGTYVRTLIEDMAENMGNLAYVKMLRRTNIDLLDGYSIYNYKQIKNMSKLQLEKCLYPLDIALKELPKIVINEQQSSKYNYGQNINIKTGVLSIHTEVRIYNEFDQIQGIGIVISLDTVKPNKVFNLY